MDEIIVQEPTTQIAVKRPFQVKFFKELNYQKEHLRPKLRTFQRTQSTRMQQTQMSLDGAISSHVGQSSQPQQDVVLNNGNRIRANWKNGQIEGQAQIYYSNGVVFKGLYKNGSKTYGHFQFLNGYEYIGYCLGNKFYGEGSLIFPSGKVISGDWRQYTLIGNGNIRYPHGQVYYGQIHNLKKHGNGNLCMNDGCKYVGEFKQGCISGEGAYYVNDKITSKGLWENGELIKSEPISQLNEANIDLALTDDGEDITLRDKKSRYSSIKRTRVSSIVEVLKMHKTAKKTKNRTVKLVG